MVFTEYFNLAFVKEAIDKAIKINGVEELVSIIGLFF